MADSSFIPRAGYRHFLPLATRWMDNDSYGHVNNVTYYSYFDTAVNEHLIRCGGLDIRNGDVVGYAVETSCRFAKPLSFPANALNRLLLNLAVFTPFLREGSENLRRWEQRFHGTENGKAGATRTAA